MSVDKRFEKEKQKIRDSLDLSEDTKKALLGRYLTEMRNSEGLKSKHTLVKHLQRLRIMFKYRPDTDHANVNIDEEFSRKIRDEIQSSEYKTKNGKGSEYAVRTKQDFWTFYKYWLKHVRRLDVDEVTPKAKFTSDKKNVDKQAETRPSDLPTAEDMRKLLNSLEQVSDKKTGKRNQAFFALLWDTGARIGEALPLQMKDVDISQDRVRIYITGNKGADNDWVTLWQTEQLMREYIQTHPASQDGEAYLFPQTYHNKINQQVNRRSLQKKMLQAKQHANLDFKTRGEPFHIFRKASSTFYVVNQIISWSEVCKRQRKKEDSTKPDYILRAMEDVDQSMAEGLGIQKQQTPSGRMNSAPLMPKKCESCGTVNNCLKNSCTSCQATLPENSLPDAEIKKQNNEASQMKKELEQMQNRINQKLEELQ